MAGAPTAPSCHGKYGKPLEGNKGQWRCGTDPICKPFTMGIFLFPHSIAQVMVLHDARSLFARVSRFSHFPKRGVGDRSLSLCRQWTPEVTEQTPNSILEPIQPTNHVPSPNFIGHGNEQEEKYDQHPWIARSIRIPFARTCLSLRRTMYHRHSLLVTMMSLNHATK